MDMDLFDPDEIMLSSILESNGSDNDGIIFDANAQSPGLIFRSNQDKDLQPEKYIKSLTEYSEQYAKFTDILNEMAKNKDELMKIQEYIYKSIAYNDVASILQYNWPNVGIFLSNTDVVMENSYIKGGIKNLIYGYLKVIKDLDKNYREPADAGADAGGRIAPAKEPTIDGTGARGEIDLDVKVLKHIIFFRGLVLKTYIERIFKKIEDALSNFTTPNRNTELMKFLIRIKNQPASAADAESIIILEVLEENGIHFAKLPVSAASPPPNDIINTKIADYAKMIGAPPSSDTGVQTKTLKHALTQLDEHGLDIFNYKNNDTLIQSIKDEESIDIILPKTMSIYADMLLFITLLNNISLVNYSSIVEYVEAIGYAIDVQKNISDRLNIDDNDGGDTWNNPELQKPELLTKILMKNMNYSDNNKVDVNYVEFLTSNADDEGREFANPSSIKKTFRMLSNYIANDLQNSDTINVKISRYLTDSIVTYKGNVYKITDLTVTKRDKTYTISSLILAKYDWPTEAEDDEGTTTKGKKKKDAEEVISEDEFTHVKLLMYSGNSVIDRDDMKKNLVIRRNHLTREILCREFNDDNLPKGTYKIENEDTFYAVEFKDAAAEHANAMNDNESEKDRASGPLADSGSALAARRLRGVPGDEATLAAKRIQRLQRGRQGRATIEARRLAANKDVKNALKEIQAAHLRMEEIEDKERKGEPHERRIDVNNALVSAKERHKAALEVVLSIANESDDKTEAIKLTEAIEEAIASIASSQPNGDDKG
jgi:hypothetical protein